MNAKIVYQLAEEVASHLPRLTSWQMSWVA